VTFAPPGLGRTDPGAPGLLQAAEELLTVKPPEPHAVGLRNASGSTHLLCPKSLRTTPTCSSDSTALSGWKRRGSRRVPGGARD